MFAVPLPEISTFICDCCCFRFLNITQSSSQALSSSSYLLKGYCILSSLGSRPALNPSSIPWFLCTAINKVNHFINNCIFLSPRESENTVGNEAWIFLSAVPSGREIGTFPTFLRMSPKPNLEDYPSHQGRAFRFWRGHAPAALVSLVLSFIAPPSLSQSWGSFQVSIWPLASHTVCLHSCCVFAC